MRNWWDPEHAAGELNGKATSVQSTVGDHIKISTMAYLPSATDYLARMQFVVTGTNAGTLGQYANDDRLWFRPWGDGTIHGVLRTPDGSGGYNTSVYDITVPYQTDKWQEWDVDYVVGTSTYTLTVGGISQSGLPAAPGAVGGVCFVNSGASAGGYYLDAVSTIPEPSTVMLLASGLLGLLAYAWRKRK